MADVEALKNALVAAHEAGDTEAATLLAEEIKAAKAQSTAQQAAPAPVAPPAARPTTVGDVFGAARDAYGSFNKGRQNIAAGGVRGAASIGSTILGIGDYIADKVVGAPQQNVRGLISGEQPMSRNEARRASVDEGLAALGADPNSWQYGLGKIGTEIAGTLGVAPSMGAGLLSMFPKAAPLATAISSGGFTAGNVAKTAPAAAKVANMATRVAGGAISGGASAGLVDPQNMGTGAMIGGLLPPAAVAVGRAGQAVRGVMRGPEVPEATREAAQAARGAGYVLPPSQARPTLANRALEGFAGKISTAQNASARNQEVTNRLAARALGLPDDAKVTPETLASVRRQAGQAYEAVKSSGTIVPGKEYGDALDAITEPFRKAAAGFPNAKPNPVIDDIESLRSTEFDAGSAIEKISQLRDEADAAYRAGNAQAGKAYKKAAGALEDAIERHLRDIQAPSDLLDGFRSARQLIAKTHSVERALSNTDGTVDARKLASQLLKGKPLSGELATIAKVAERFPKAVQPVEKMGSLPQVSPLDFGALGTASAITQNPLLMAGVLARPAARSAALSGPVQNRLATKPMPGLLEMLASDPTTMPLVLRAAPVVAAGQR